MSSDRRSPPATLTLLHRLLRAARRAWAVLRHGAAHLQALEARTESLEVQNQNLQRQWLQEIQQVQSQAALRHEAHQAELARLQEQAASLARQLVSHESHLQGHAAHLQGLQAHQVQMEAGAQGLSQAVHHHAQSLQAHASQIDAQAAHLSGLSTHIEAHTVAVSRHLSEHGAHLNALQQATQRVHHRLGLDRPSLNDEQRDSFYLALEAEFRGSPEDVQRRQTVYRHWLDEAPPGPVADLGCGRGEWLALLSAWGRSAQGVDANALNVEHGRAKGLAIEQADALQWLVAQPDASLAALTAFHLAEHLPFDDLHLIVRHAQRVLLPGGLLILETPNPENLEVATHTFWLDPTHRRPLPPGLLSALARTCGLQVVTVLRLNPPEDDPGPVQAERLLQSLIQGRDCALVARKPGPAPA